MNGKIETPTVYRYERKFLIPRLNLGEAESIVRLHPAMFSLIYHERTVNNIYFDNTDLKHYFDNVDGLSDRVKVRIRWYGEMTDKVEAPVLEIKRKSGFVGTKDYLPLQDFALNRNRSIPDILDQIRYSMMPENLRRELILMEPVLLNQYTRKYFLSADGHFRLTLDNDIRFYPADKPYPYFLHHGMEEHAIILELKYNETKDDEAQSITNHFPFRLTKSSKYVTGLTRLFSFA